MKELNLKTNINGLNISTVYNRFERVYETLVTDRLGNELRKISNKYKTDAKHEHFYCVVHYTSPRNCIHFV